MDETVELEALIDVYTGPGDLVLDATGAVVSTAIDTGRICVALVPEVVADGLEPPVRRVDVESVPDAIAAFTSEARLIITSGTATGLPGWWVACRGALVAGGHVAVVVSAADPRLHAELTAAATAAGVGYVQHLVVVSTGVLDDALAEATSGDARVRARVHRRAHRDVFVFTSPGPIQPMGVHR